MFENGMECSIHYIILDVYLNVHQRPPPNAFTYMNRNVNSNRKQLMGRGVCWFGLHHLITFLITTHIQ